MKKLYFDMNSNLKNTNIGQVEKADSVELEVTLLQEEDYSDSSFRLLGNKADSKKVEQKDNYILKLNKVIFTLKREFLSCPGIVKLELNISNAGKEYTTSMFYIRVSDTINSNIIESIEDVETLKELEDYVKNANNTLNDANNTLGNLEAVNNAIIPNENKREEFELIRKQNEKNRNENERDRITGEKVRKLNEENRTTTEDERIENEETRKNNELNRKTAENLRVSRENAREQAEIQRQELFEENESVRNENENTRIKRESKRVAAEVVREANEDDRILQELDRQKKEETRETNETSRVEAEKIREQQEENREQHYNNFDEAETARIEAEKIREANENARVTAESNRNNEYEKAEKNRNDSFDEAEKNRTTIYNASELERTNNEEQRVLEESKRDTRETARVEAEKERVTAEELRIEAENARVIAEQERASAEVVREEKIEEFGSQVTKIANISLPSVYLDFPKRIRELKVGSKDFTATFDSLMIVEKNTTGTGNEGFNIQVPSTINTIEFDIEQLNFGINCGLYYYVGETLKKSYITYSRPVSNTIKHTKGIKFVINWEEVNKSMDANGYDDLRFIVWNANGSLVNGYNYLTNIKVNDFKKVEELNKSISNIESELKTTFNTENISITSIKNNNKIVGITSNLIKWLDGANITYNKEDDTLKFIYNLTTGNNGFKTKDFKSIGNAFKISGEVIEIDGVLSINVSGFNNEGVQKYYQIGLIKKVGKFEIDCSLVDLFKKREPLNINDLSVVFSNGTQNISLIIKNIEVVDIDTNFTGSNLKEVLSNLQYEDIKNDNIIISKTMDLKKWGGVADLILSDNLLRFNHNTESGNTGAITDNFISKTNFVKVKGNTLSINKYNSDSKMQICVVGKNINTGTTKYIKTNYITEIGKFDFSIDLNNLAVYKELDLTKPIQILLGSINKVSIEIQDYTVYENKLPQANLITEKLDETLLNFDQAITTINSKLEGLDSNSDASLISPNGTRFILQVSNEGVITAIPTIPNKVLFIGNSLLLGHGTFGMCATNSKNDYYYYIKEYLKAFNPNVLCDKLLGAPFEQTETQSGIDSWIASNINSKANDYDLVVIQLGDNVNNDIRNELFKTSCKQLLQAIRNHMQKARVVWIGEWYYTAQRQNIIAKSCAETGSTFIDITDLTTKENQGALGTTITRDDGSTFEVVSTGVASHPGNKGMKAIADRIIEKLF